MSNDETPDFSYPPSQPQTSSLDQLHCFHCKDPLEEGERCQRCTCKWCGYGLREGSCWICPSRDENSSIDAPNSFNDLKNVFTYPSQPQYETYLCELCGNNSYHGYDCPPWFLLVYEQEPSYNQNKWCGSGLSKGFCFICASRDENSYINVPNPNSFNDPPNILNHPPQPQYESYSCELCGNDSHYGYDYPPQFRLVYEQEPCYNQNFGDNDYPYNSPRLLITGNEELSTIPKKESDEFIKSSVKDLVLIPSESEDTSESDSDCDLASCDDFSPIDAPEAKSVTFSNLLFDLNDDVTSSDDESLSDEEVPEDNVKKNLNPLFEFNDEYISSDINPLFDEVFGNIENKDSYVFDLDEPALLDTPLSDFNKDEYGHGVEVRLTVEIVGVVPIPRRLRSSNFIVLGVEIRERLKAANLSTHTPEPSQCFNSIYYDGDDDEESTILLNEIISQLPLSSAITLVLPIASVDDLVLIPSESEDSFESDSDCDLPLCDNFSPINVSKGKSMTFSNPIFDSNDDVTSSDDESLSDEDVPKDNVKKTLNPLFEFNDEYISSDINPLFDEVFGNIENKDSYVFDLDEPALLDTPLSDFNKDECFNPGGDIDEIDAFLDTDVSTNIKDGYHDNDNLMTDDKVFDPWIPEKIVSPTYVSLPFEDCHYLSLTHVIRIFLPYFTYPVESPFLLSFGSEDTTFDPDISVLSFYSLELVASHWSRTFMCLIVYLNILNESLMEICSSTCFDPNITMIWGESS
ncbi:hypothetical protein Tco_1088196 [Tanacetum coccineum]